MSEEEKNMYEELFIGQNKRGGEYFIPYTTKRKCLQMLRSKGKQEVRNRGLVMLTEWYRFETSRNGGKYDSAACDELIGIIRDFWKRYPA